MKVYVGDRMKAVIPAAGLGTRFLPVTKSMPKEMLPIIDKPVIQYVVEEAILSGIGDIIIITGRKKRAIEDHFDKNFEYRIRVYLSDYLARKAKRSNRDNGLDLVEEEGQRNTSLFLIYKGDAENSKVYYDKERTRKKIAKEIKKEKDKLKAILREDVGIFKKDTSSFLIREEQQKKAFRVEWPEEENKKEKTTTPQKDTSSGKKFKVIWEEEPDSIPKKKPVYR